MANFLKEQSFGELIRNTFRIYGRYFIPIVLTYLILVYPWQFLYSMGFHEQNTVFMVIGVVLVMASSLFAMAIVTLLISDVCVGNKISLARYFKRAFGTILGKLLLTNLLQTIIIAIGFILLVIPGLVFMVWFLFAGSIVVLEEKWGVQALKRSRILGKGYYLRNFGVFFVLLIVVIMISAVIGFIVGILGATVIDTGIGGLGLLMFQDLVQVVTTPIWTISFILMYYDLRVRKEAYNNDVLAEELRR